MMNRWNRRELLKRGLAACFFLPRHSAGNTESPEFAGKDFELRVSSVTPHTLRLTIVASQSRRQTSIPSDGSLLENLPATPSATLHADHIPSSPVQCGDFLVSVPLEPLTVSISRDKSPPLQRFVIDQISGAISFPTGDAPLFGLGEGGKQFDRRGELDPMISGQGGYRLHTHGGRVPIPWLMSASGWAIFLHQPY